MSTTQKPNHALLDLARTALQSCRPEDGPFDAELISWAVGRVSHPNPLEFAATLIDAMLLIFDREFAVWRPGEPSRVCYGTCALPDHGCSFDFGNGLAVRHVLGGWSVATTVEGSDSVHADRMAAERVARRAATLAAVAVRLERRRAAEAALCGVSGGRSVSAR